MMRVWSNGLTLRLDVLEIIYNCSFVLESCEYNLTRLAREWILPPLRGYEAVVSRIFDILLRKENTKLPYNPLLIDGDEMRRWRVILEVLRRLTVGDAPEPLLSLQVIAPNFVALSGVSLSAVLRDVTDSASEVETRLAQLLLGPSFDVSCTSEALLARFKAFFSASCQAEDHVLLLLNNFDWLVGGVPLPDAISIAPLLVPALARRQIQLLGISTLVQYRQYIERDAGIQRRVQPIVLRSDEEIQQKSSS